MSVHLGLGMGRITEGTSLESPEVENTLTISRSGGWGCLQNWKYITSFKQQQRVGPIYRVPGPETFKQEKAEAACRIASQTSTRLILASRWSIGGFFVVLFLEPAVALCVFLFVFSLWGPHGKELNSFLCELQCVPVQSLFFHNVVSYIFIKPHHIFFTVKILKGCFQVGWLMKF